jgi:cell division transport system permease protein
MFSNLEFFIVEAFRSFYRGALMTMVAVITITISIVIFGTFVLSVLNLGNLVGNVSSGLDIAAYIDKPISLEEAGKVQIELSKIPGVAKVDFVSRTEAWENFQNEFQHSLNLSEVVQGNPLPHTFIVKVKHPDLLAQVAKIISLNPQIDDVRYSGELVKQMQSLINAVRVGGAALVILISIATLLIVVNTIRLTVLARSTDIYIMKLVGATDAFVKWPFIIEGVMIGLFGGLFSFILLKFSYDAVVKKVVQTLPFIPMVTDAKVLFFIYLVMVIGGMAMGMLGAYISVGRVLKAEIK